MLHWLQKIIQDSQHLLILKDGERLTLISSLTLTRGVTSSLTKSRTRLFKIHIAMKTFCRCLLLNQIFINVLALHCDFWSCILYNSLPLSSLCKEYTIRLGVISDQVIKQEALQQRAKSSHKFACHRHLFYHLYHACLTFFFPSIF